MSEINDLKYIERNPAQAEFCTLRSNAGWPLPPDSILNESLARTIFSVCVETTEGKAIGMGRVVGDGGIQLFIPDIIVQNEWQNKGIGKKIMSKLMAQIKTHASPATFVGLFSAFGLEEFYKKFGFIMRPNKALGAGMMFFPEEK